jgi:hypothetical protein
MRCSGLRRSHDGAWGGRGRRLGAVSGALLLWPAPTAARADTTATTGIAVTTENTGSFTIAFAGADPDAGYTLVDAAGNTEIPVSAVDGNTAIVRIELAWEDTRADGARLPYTIALGASDLESKITNPAGGVYAIPAANLSITQIADQTVTSPLPLNVPQIILTSAATPAAGNGSLNLMLRLDIPPSTYPTSYTTTLTVTVAFVGQSTP